jgi:hypothetical protein
MSLPGVSSKSSKVVLKQVNFIYVSGAISILVQEIKDHELDQQCKKRYYN